MMVRKVESPSVHQRAGNTGASHPREPIQNSLTDRYETLVSYLGKIEEAADEKKIDRLEAVWRALSVVITFLQADPRIGRQGSQRSLFELFCAVHDLSQGAKPALFFKYKREGGQGAPTNRSAAVKRAQIVLALEILLKAGIAKQEACKWLANELHRCEIIANAKRILPKQVLRWHDEKGGKSISGFDQVYKALEADVVSRGWPAIPSAAKKRAAKLIQALKRTGI